jgi:hypothetical protein
MKAASFLSQAACMKPGHDDTATWHRRLQLSQMLGLVAFAFPHPVCPRQNLEGVLVAQFGLDGIAEPPF